MDNKLDINVTKKKVSDENLLKTVEEALMQNELCLFMGETGTFMTTGTTDDAEEIFSKLQSVLLAGFLSMEKATDYDIEQILLLQLEAVKEIKINKIDTRIQLTAMAAILKPSEMSDTDFVLKINEKISELWSEEALIRQGAKINQELLEIQKTLDEIEKQGNM